MSIKIGSQWSELAKFYRIYGKIEDMRKTVESVDSVHILLENLFAPINICHRIITILDIIHRHLFYLKRRFGDWSLSPSSGGTYPVFQTQDTRWIMPITVIDILICLHQRLVCLN
jgi:hypothetical protein